MNLCEIRILYTKFNTLNLSVYLCVGKFILDVISKTFSIIKGKGVIKIKEIIIKDNEFYYNMFYKILHNFGN